MKILLCTLNAKYIHSSLALAYLNEFCQSDRWEIEVKELTINENLEDIMAEIYLSRPDIICFSVYIWNITPVLEICRDYKKVAPESVIILGGPEVSYDSAQVLADNPCVDYIVRGEGEYSLKELLQHIYDNASVAEVKGISYQVKNQIYENPDRELINNLDTIPTPYYGDITYYKDRTIYYETSRGCPFNCSYCLSSTIRGVRFFPLDRVRKDLHFLINQGVREVKFVDRTFNCHEKRAIELMRFIIDEKGTTKFHFEICADLLSDEMMAFLKDVPPGLFDFEIGIQSTCPAALETVQRKMDWNRLSHNIKALKAYDNIHLHLDLIAGLPCEDYTTFAKSFNDVYFLNPDVIQLGFLKLLKGSKIRDEFAIHGYKFQEKPPYQVLTNNYISYGELIELTRVEDILERYFNSGNMAISVAYIINKIYSGNAFHFYEQFARYWEEHGYFKIGHRREAEYTFLQNFVNDYHGVYAAQVNERLKYDYLISSRSYTLPENIHSCNPVNSNEILNSCLRDEIFVDQYLPQFKTKTIREMKKQLRIEYFRFDAVKGTDLTTPVPVLFVYNPITKKAQKAIYLKDHIGN
ncbi:MAG: B12-binding domain-containing radical SAM protein [Syntrophomonadaceae bacterium]|nr:B12-binding domain-containing radical SAM protein [Syntrophomonadaceae bacterium]MDD3890158.1 B12-binding domain-containing radical SAM protein [Syntrophomonadaceae bacterium]MDD4549270.1 B12-binding domain-containing radical SAM protein [Syntrophomonadaceae bacterium]